MATNHEIVSLRVITTDLGPHNLGALGPQDLDQITRDEVIRDLAAPEYSRPASRRWICVDGRLSAEEAAALEAGELLTADPQIGGGIVVTEVASTLMDDEEPAQPLSQLAAELTDAAIEDDIEVTVHGDDEKGAGGCKAKVAIQDVLKFNAANIDIVAPKVWEVAVALRLDAHITPDDVTKSILTGIERANQTELWDVTPDEFDAIVIEHGGSAITLKGKHSEKAVRASLVPGEAFAKAKYVKDHSTITKEIEAFSASFGEYNAETFRRARQRGQSERNAALRVMRAVAYNVGLTKQLQDDTMPTGLIVAAS